MPRQEIRRNARKRRLFRVGLELEGREKEREGGVCNPRHPSRSERASEAILPPKMREREGKISRFLLCLFVRVVRPSSPAAVLQPPAPLWHDFFCPRFGNETRAHISRYSSSTSPNPDYNKDQVGLRKGIIFLLERRTSEVTSGLTGEEDSSLPVCLSAECFRQQWQEFPCCARSE